MALAGGEVAEDEDEGAAVALGPGRCLAEFAVVASFSAVAAEKGSVPWAGAVAGGATTLGVAGAAGVGRPPLTLDSPVPLPRGAGPTECRTPRTMSSPTAVQIARTGRTNLQRPPIARFTPCFPYWWPSAPGRTSSLQQIRTRAGHRVLHPQPLMEGREPPAGRPGARPSAL